MHITFFGNGNRGLACLEALTGQGYKINCIVVHPDKRAKWEESAQRLGVDLISPDNPNEKSVREFLSAKNSDVFVLAGYGKILKSEIIALPKKMCVNLHGGKLPQYRGSSPMNWSLINGEEEFTLSIIQVDTGVDTGDVLLDKTYPIAPTDTIRELHAIANRDFPQMLLAVVRMLDEGTVAPRKQVESDARYFPLRFPEDGLIVWDLLSAEEVYNRIRALTEPYPCAYTYYHNKKIKLVAAEKSRIPFFGEAGRIYRKTDKGLLVCARDQSLWITAAYEDATQKPLSDIAERYQKFITASGAAVEKLKEGTAL